MRAWIRIILIATFVSGLSLQHVTPAAAACQDVFREWHFDDGIIPTPVVNGGRISLYPRTMVANDWASMGFISEHIWVFTGAGSLSWIEVWVGDGGAGSSSSRFGTARTINYPDIYDEFYWTGTPAWGTLAWLTVRPGVGTNAYVAEFSQGLASGAKSWTGSGSTTPHMNVGMESTHQCNRLDRSYVNNIQWRRKADGQWVNVTNQHLRLMTSPSGVPSLPGIAWCGAVTRFINYMNSQAGTSGCS